MDRMMTRIQSLQIVLLIFIHLAFLCGCVLAEDCDVIENCSVCPNPPIQCLACKDNAIPSADGLSCLDCPAHCKRCRHDNGQSVCESCEGGYYLRALDNTCQVCVAGCVECVDSDTGPNCTQCGSGMYHNTGHVQCTSCPSNCAECSGSSQCTTCRQGFYVDSTGLCQGCPGGVTQCMSCTGADRCDRCITGHYYDGSACVECTDNCDQCPDGQSCDMCQSGHFLAPDRTSCVSASLCEPGMYADLEGCSKCLEGNRLGLMNTCYACPDLNRDTCNSCRSETRGHFYDSERNLCSFCPEYCISCDNGELCSDCVDGYVWNTDTSSCVSCSMEMEGCGQCDGLYQEGENCRVCPSEAAVMTTEEACTSCTTAQQGLKWIQGTCTDVDCSSDLQTRDECLACKGKVWNEDSQQCTAVDCEALESLGAEEECRSCSRTGSSTAWEPALCSNVLCIGTDFTSESTCTACKARMWNDEQARCLAVNCAVLSLVNTQQWCKACTSPEGPHTYWDTTTETCQEIDCSSEFPDNEEKCFACRSTQLFWQIEECLLANCESPPETKSECLACSGKYWRDSDQTCQDLSELCVGTSLFTDTKEKCLYCSGQYWTGTQCNGMACHDAESASSKSECEACPRRYWIQEENFCYDIDVECDLAELVSPQRCHACRHQGFIWQETLESCEVFTECDSLSGVHTQEECSTCPGKFWNPPSCSIIDCSKETERMIEFECVNCAGKEWVQLEDGRENCQDLPCSDPASLDEESVCDSCIDTGMQLYWDGQICQALEVDCAVDYLGDSLRCGVCSTEEGPKVWDPQLGICKACPDYCTECDHTMSCIRCAEDRTWNPQTNMCEECLSAVLDNQIMCESCPAKFWNSAKSECTDCVTDCEVCSNIYTCDECKTGFVWQHEQEMCVGCVITSESECVSCAVTEQGKLFDEDTGLCTDCPLGCSQCTDVICEMCATGYFLQDGLCYSCAAGDLGTQVECDSCGDSVFWDSTQQRCTACMDDCDECRSSESCIHCSLGHYFNADEGMCSNCLSSCVECSGSGDCEMCTDNYYFDSQQTLCLACPSQCVLCDPQSGCQSCTSGFYLKDSLCQACKSGCTECSEGDTCDQCEAELCYDPEARECYGNSENCQTCKRYEDGSISCITCGMEAVLDVCVVCTDPQCMTCEDNPYSCSQCNPGFYKDGTMCKACPGSSLCVNCTDVSECTTCIPGHYYDTTQNTCLGCLFGCAECSTSESCHSCEVGYFYNTPTMTCDHCITHCDQCTTAIDCSQCQQQYYFDLQVMACLSCSDAIPQCHSCTLDIQDSSTPVCESCVAGFTLSEDGTSCVSCDITSCTVCEDRPTYCDVCDTGYVPQLPHQTKCHPGCVTCSDGDDCVTATLGENVTIDTCEGLGQSHACWTYRWEDSQGLVTYERGCYNTPCTDLYQTEVCDSTGKVLDKNMRCSRCCTDHGCNSDQLTGHSSSVLLHYSVTTLLSLILSVIAI